jgi:hypothetical protein
MLLSAEQMPGGEWVDRAAGRGTAFSWSVNQQRNGPSRMFSRRSYEMGFDWRTGLRSLETGRRIK